VAAGAEYPPRDLAEKDVLVDQNLQKVEEGAERIRDMAALCGYVDRNDSGKRLFNIVDQSIVASSYYERKDLYNQYVMKILRIEPSRFEGSVVMR